MAVLASSGAERESEGGPHRKAESQSDVQGGKMTLASNGEAARSEVVGRGVRERSDPQVWVEVGGGCNGALGPRCKAGGALKRTDALASSRALE